MNQNKVEKVAIRLADRIGLVNITKDKLCFEVGIPSGSFNAVMGCSFTNFICKLHAGNNCKLGELTGRGRANPNLMINFILNCALEISEEVGYKSLTRAIVAERSKISPALISYYFNDMDNLKKSVIEHAIKNKNLIVIAQALTIKDRAVKNISEKLKADALKAAINA